MDDDGVHEATIEELICRASPDCLGDLALTVVGCQVQQSGGHRGGNPVVVEGRRDLDGGSRTGAVGLDGGQPAAGVPGQRPHLHSPSPGRSQPLPADSRLSWTGAYDLY